MLSSPLGLVLLIHLIGRWFNDLHSFYSCNDQPFCVGGVMHKCMYVNCADTHKGVL